MSNHVTWFEVTGQDAASLRQFYAGLFGWKYQIPTGMDYGMTDCADTGIAGGVGKAMQGPGGVTFYVTVDDINATLSQAEAAGGKTLMPRTEMPDVTLAMFADPEGHAIGLVEAKAQA